VVTELFAVGTTDAQVTWRHLPPGTVTVESSTARVEVEHRGGPGTVTIGGLTPDAPFELAITLGGPGDRVVRRCNGATLPVPPGAERFRIATISDLHIGEQRFGYFHTIGEQGAVEPYPLRCARAAIAEATAWGAALLVVKGDAAHQSHPELWEQTAALLDEAPMPVVLLPGNHERKEQRTIESRRALAGTDITVADRTLSVLDVPGLRVLLADSTRHARDVGGLDGFRAEALTAAGEAPGGALMLMHHHLARRPVYTQLPFGVPKREADRFLSDLGRANPDTLVSCGHTHRHRRDQVGPVTVATVGSVKDYPGVWAGYVVHDGGIVQTVRRIAEPSTLAWTDFSGRAMGGLYRHWTPGRLSDRCFTLRWGG
jgi:3',5'-cyclic AMP phosphodiesterase CpdA